MRSHYKRGKPGATKTEVERDFTERLPEHEHGYIRPLRMSEFPPEAELGKRYLVICDGAGERRACAQSLDLLLVAAKEKGVTVHPYN